MKRPPKTLSTAIAAVIALAAAGTCFASARPPQGDPAMLLAPKAATRALLHR
jgi:hypothetical protein